MALKPTPKKSVPFVTVLMIVDDYPPLLCGVGNYTASLVTALAAIGVSVTVLTKRVEGIPAFEECAGVPVYREIRGWFISEVAHIVRRLDGLGANCIMHVQYASGSGYNRRLMINILPALVRVFRPRQRVVLTLHGFHEQRLRWRVRAAPMLMASEACVCVHHKDQAMVRRLLVTAKIGSVLIRQAAAIPAVNISERDRSERRLSLHFSDGDHVVAFFGGLRADKGFDMLIDVVATVRSQGLPIKLLVITPSVVGATIDRGVLGALEKAIAEGWTTVVEAAQSESVPLFLNAADLAIFPFIMGASENRSSLLAAIMCGLPVLTTRGPSTPVRFEEDYGVDTVPARDRKALASRLEALVRQPNDRAALQEKAVCAGRSLSWDAVATSTLSLYQRLLDATRKSAPVA